MDSPLFKVVVRLPFARGHFVDPPHVLWDAEKDRQLWKVVSKSSKTSDLNWAEMAARYQVPPRFLIQQAAWLYERHLDHVRNQMKKVDVPVAAAISSSGSLDTTTSGVAMRKTENSSLGVPERASVLSVGQMDDPQAGEDIVSPLSRTPSTTTITQSIQAPIQTISTGLAPRFGQERGLQSSTLAHTSPVNLHSRSGSHGTLNLSSSSSSSLSDPDHPAHRSQLFKRPPRFRQQRLRDLGTFDEDDGTQEVEYPSSYRNPTLHFASTAELQDGKDIGVQEKARYARAGSGQEPTELECASNVVSSQRSHTVQHTRSQSSRETVFSTKDHACNAPESAVRSSINPIESQLADRVEMGSRTTDTKKEESDDTPSMDSSFSDIDDTGISRSALEEALLSNMQHGKMSTLSRMSRYL